MELTILLLDICRVMTQMLRNSKFFASNSEQLTKSNIMRNIMICICNNVTINIEGSMEQKHPK